MPSFGLCTIFPHRIPISSSLSDGSCTDIFRILLSHSCPDDNVPFLLRKTAILPSVPDAHSLFLLMNAHAFFRSWSLMSLFPYRIPYCTAPFRDAGTRCFFTQPIVFFSFIGITQYELPATHYLLNIWLRFQWNTDTHLTHTNQLKGLSRGDLLCNTALILRICCRWSVSQWSVPPFPLFIIRHHPEVLSQDNNHIFLRCDTIDLM